MLVFTGDCPHCLARYVAFEILGEIQIEGTRDVKKIDIFGKCGYCQRGVMAMAEKSNDGRYQPINISPSLPSNDPPEYTPENVGVRYRQGMDNMNGNWDAAGTMFRKTLEVALNERFPDYQGSLMKRINKAAADNALTKEMAEWANQIRKFGNEAAHDELFSKEDAQTMQTFTNLVLLYLFTLPGMMKEAQNRSGEESEDEC